MDELNINFTSTSLSSELKMQLLLLLGKVRDIFTTDLTEVMGADKYSHHIDTGSAKPIRVPPYSANPIRQHEIDKQIKVLHDADIIKEAMTLWQAPVVMVKKQHVAPGE